MRFVKPLLRLVALAILAAILSLLLLLGVGVVHTRGLEVQDRVAASPHSGHYVDAGDTRIFIQELGSPKAPAVVFIHGTGAWGEIWRPQMNLLAAKGYRAIAVDMPPFGYSLPPQSGKYDKASQARRICATLDSMGIQQAAFVSHSIGASPLMEALLTQPQRVTRLVLVSPALGLDSPLTDGSDSRTQQLLRHPWVSETLAAGIFTNPIYTDWLVKRFVAEKDKLTPAWVDRYRQPMSVRGYYQGVARWMPELLAGRTTLPSDTPMAYRAITFPVDLIWGRDDQITPLPQGEHLHALIKQSRLHILPGGHVPMIEEPQTFNRLLVDAFPDAP